MAKKLEIRVEVVESETPGGISVQWRLPSGLDYKDLAFKEARMTWHVILEERDTSTPNPQWHLTSELVAVYGPFPSYAAAEAMASSFKDKGIGGRTFTIHPLTAP